MLQIIAFEDDQQKQIAATLIPLFRRLNRCLTTNSWYLSSYAADWQGIQRTLESVLHFLTGHRQSADNKYGKGKSSSTGGEIDILKRGERITLDLATAPRLEGSPRPERIIIWLKLSR